MGFSISSVLLFPRKGQTRSRRGQIQTTVNDREIINQSINHQSINHYDSYFTKTVKQQVVV
jgi:hypothetical protein